MSDKVSEKTKESVYDEQINPLMQQIIEICKQHNINAHSTFFLDEDLLCTTHLKLEGDPLALELLYLSSRCRNNIDSLFIAISRNIHEGRFRDGGSMILSMLDRFKTENAAAIESVK